MIKIVLTTILILLSIQSNADVPNNERDSLISIFNAANGQNWTHNTNWNTAMPVSSWYGITVTEIEGIEHVTQIILSMNNLSGIIHNAIGNLTKIQVLDLWNNQLTGIIPNEIGNCVKLKTLYLDNNQFSGGLPTTLSNLNLMEDFWLSFNLLSGDVTSIYSSWPNLIYLGIDNTLLTGDVVLSNNPNLILLYAYNSNFSSINIQNNSNSQLIYFEAFNCPNLVCLQVDNLEDVINGVSPYNNWVVDASSLYSEDCSALNTTTIKQANAILFYPNPASNYLNTNSDSKIIEIKIFDLLGKLVFTQNDNLGIVTFNISNLKKGIYYVKSIDLEANSAYTRIIKN